MEKITKSQLEENITKHEIDKSHKEALRAAKVGKKVAGRAVRMARKGIVEQSIQTRLLLNETADVTSVNLAANAELKAKGHELTATYNRRYDSLGDDYDAIVKISDKADTEE